jgi:hypothetical protein
MTEVDEDPELVLAAMRGKLTSLAGRLEFHACRRNLDRAWVELERAGHKLAKDREAKP